MMLLNKALSLVNRPSIRASLLNTIAFSVYVFSQQIILLPHLASSFNPLTVSAIFIFISIYSVTTNSLGHELGITQQLIAKGIITRGWLKSFQPALFMTNVLVLMVIFISMIIIHLDLLTCAILGLVAVMGNTRLYFLGFMRSQGLFKYILLQNIFYLIGVIFGLIIIGPVNLFWIPFLSAEIFSLLVAFVGLHKIKSQPAEHAPTTTHKIMKVYKDMWAMSFINNLLAYADRIIILPVAGAHAMNAYFAGNVSSKVVGIMVNPLNAVFLTSLAKRDVRAYPVAVARVLRIGVIIGILVSAVTLPLTYVVSSALYSQFIDGIYTIIPAVALGCGFETAASVLRIVLLKVDKAATVSRIYIFFSVMFIVVSIMGAYLGGLVGFAYSVAALKIFLFCLLAIRLRIKENNNGEE